jgi:hypothetical protein
VKTVALKDPNTGLFSMMQLSGFGSISADDREAYGTRVSLGNVKTLLDLKETRLSTLEVSAVGIVDGGRAGLSHVEAIPINGGSASV